jgi:BirA family transcriptional regulator, biotin operon repressor / biotin---[acetyl-CoA-carboxylase] ligase
LSVYTDDPAWAASLLPAAARFETCPDTGPGLRPLLHAFFAEPPVRAASPDAGLWRPLLVSGHARGSQYERLIRLARAGVALPHGLACVARSGTGLQGFHGRGWAAAPGNIHLSVHLAPGREIPRFESVFMALAAVAVVETIDAVAGLAGRARIRWVNDVLIDGAKVAGVLAHTQTRGATVTSVVLGIGLNVETRPEVRPTPFVPRAAALRGFVPSDPPPALREVLWLLLRRLEANYRRLLADGYGPIVERYRGRSEVLGREVFVSADTPDEVPHLLAAGRVARIGDGLELHLEGRAQPVTRGRLLLGEPAAAALRAGGRTPPPPETLHARAP